MQKPSLTWEVPPLSPRGEVAEGQGLWFPGVTLPETKTRIGPDKYLTRTLLRIVADLGNCGLKKRDPVPGTLTTAQGSDASLLRNWGEPETSAF